MKGWVGIVGSRGFGLCGCLGDRTKHARPSDCRMVQAFQLSLSIITRLAQDPEFEGVVSGEAAGADSLAKTAAKMLDVPYKGYPVKPGPEPFAYRAKRRNGEIVAKSSMVIALYAPGPRSPGTTDTVTKAKTAGLPVHIYHEGRWSSE